jgi:hypothetical protein
MEVETKTSPVPPPPAPVKRMVSAPVDEGNKSKITDENMEQIVNAMYEMNITGDFPCTPQVAACYAMFYLHVVGGHPYEDLTVDDVVNWFFGNGKDKDKTNWASGIPRGFKRVKDGYVVTPSSTRSSSPVHQKKQGDNRIIRVIAPTLRDWWWMQTYIRWPYDLMYETMHMNVSASQLDRTMNTMVTSLLRVRRDGLKHEQKDVLFCEKDTGFASCVCPAMLQDTCGCRSTSSSDGDEDNMTTTEEKKKDDDDDDADDDNDESSRVFLLLPTDPQSNASTVARTYGCEPTCPMLWNIVCVALQCAIVWIAFRIFGTHHSDSPSLFSSSSSQLVGFMARGMSPDNEYLECLAGEGSAWDLLASYAYCAFYAWVIIVWRDDLTPVYRLWYVCVCVCSRRTVSFVFRRSNSHFFTHIHTGTTISFTQTSNFRHQPREEKENIEEISVVYLIS